MAHSVQPLIGHLLCDQPGGDTQRQKALLVKNFNADGGVGEVQEEETNADSVLALAVGWVIREDWRVRDWSGSEGQQDLREERMSLDREKG